MVRLRSAQGCPWDRQQTIQSLLSFMLEESYEVIEAHESGDPSKHCEELGDLLFQIVFQCQVAKEAGQFDFAAVADGIARKLVRRHPHVFGDASVENSREVELAWERIKQAEKAEAGQTPESILDGVPRNMPALLAAQRLSERASRVGFDWESADQVLDKIREESAELEQAMVQRHTEAGREHVAWEIGDLLLALCNLARHLDLGAEDVLRAANRRFRDRFAWVEKIAKARGIELRAAGIEVLESLWQEAKRKLAESPTQDTRSGAPDAQR